MAKQFLKVGDKFVLYDGGGISLPSTYDNEPIKLPDASGGNVLQTSTGLIGTKWKSSSSYVYEQNGSQVTLTNAPYTQKGSEVEIV